MKYIYPKDRVFAEQCLKEAGIAQPIWQQIEFVARLNAQRMEPLTTLQIQREFS